MLCEEVRWDSQLAGTCAQVAQGRPRRFLHHVAELARENNVLVSARKQGRFDEKYVAPGLGPGDAGRHPGPRHAEGDFLLEPRRTEVIVHLIAVDCRFWMAGASGGWVAMRAATFLEIVPS